MSTVLLHLTPFEEQVLKAIKRYLETEGAVGSWFYDQEIVDAGRQLFSSQWGGRAVIAPVENRHPLINRFFGRLHNKGILTRTPSSYQWGKWELTEVGHELLGLSPDH